MAKHHSPVADFSVYLAVKLLGCALLMLPLAWAAGIVRALSRLAYRVDRRHRLVALDNLRHSFPGRYTERQLSDLVRGIYEHFAQLLLEMLLIPRKLNRRSLEVFYDSAEGRAFLTTMASGRPIVLVTAHYGNWEAAAYILGRSGFRGHLVGRPLDNPFLDDEVRRFRERPGHRLLSKDGDVREMVAVLRQKGLLVTLADQDAGPNGLFVDFFGRPASTHKAIAALAFKQSAVIVVGGARNAGLLDYRIWAPDIIDARDYLGHPNAIVALTQRITSAIECAIRRDPRQYLWLHRRWKHQPPTARAA